MLNIGGKNPKNSKCSVDLQRTFLGTLKTLLIFSEKRKAEISSASNVKSHQLYFCWQWQLFRNSKIRV